MDQPSHPSKKPLSLTEGPLLPTLLRFTLPILWTILLQVTYGTVDLMIVGQFSTTAELSGTSVGAQIIQTVTNFCTGIALGVTILLGQYIGAKEGERASLVVGASIPFFTLLSGGITLFMLVFVEEIALAMNTPAASFQQTKTYLIITGCGAVFIVFYNLIGNIFRGIGDSRTPLYAVVIAAVVNIILDLILVAGFGLGAAGAAIATVVAQGLSVAISLVLLRKKGLPFPFHRRDITWNGPCIANILRLGIPVALQGVLVGFSFLVMTSILNEFGEATSAAVGVVEKITGLIMVVPLAFSQSMAAFAAQNVGAGQLGRAKKGLGYSVGISLCFGTITAYISAFHGHLLINLFVDRDNTETIAAAVEYLRSYSLDAIFVCFLFCVTGFFNGCGRTKFVMVQAVFGAVFVRIPLAYYLKSLGSPLFVIGLATPSSTVVQLVMIFIYYQWFSRQKENLALN